MLGRYLFSILRHPHLFSNSSETSVRAPVNLSPRSLLNLSTVTKESVSPNLSPESLCSHSIPHLAHRALSVPPLCRTLETWEMFSNPTTLTSSSTEVSSSPTHSSAPCSKAPSNWTTRTSTRCQTPSRRNLGALTSLSTATSSHSHSIRPQQVEAWAASRIVAHEATEPLTRRSLTERSYRMTLEYR